MRILVNSILFVVFMLFATTSFAVPFAVDSTGTEGDVTYVVRDGDSGLYSGVYMFTVTNPDNDNLTVSQLVDLSMIMSDYFDATTAPLTFYSKVEAPDTTAVIETPPLPPMFVSYTDTYTGTWSTEGVPVEYYTVKGANEFAIYWLEGGASEGDWSSEHVLKNDTSPAMSHVSTFNAAPAPVPEPSTLLLLGAGISGLVFFRRKKK